MQNKMLYYFHSKISSVFVPILFSLFCFPSICEAQGESPALLVNIKFIIENGSLDDAKIEIRKNGKTVKNMDDVKSKTRLELEYGNDYMFTFSKPGYVTKRIIFSTKLPPEMMMAEFEEYPFSVSLFEQYEGVNAVVFNQPIARISYRDEKKDFDYDTDYTKSIQSEIKKFESEMLAQKEKAEKKKKEEEEAKKAAIARAEEEAKAQKKLAQQQAEEEARKQKAQIQAEEEARKAAIAKAGEEEKNRKAQLKAEEESKKAALAKKEEEERARKAQSQTEEEAKKNTQAKAGEEDTQKKAALAKAEEEKARKAKMQAEEDAKRNAQAKAVEEERRRKAKSQAEEEAKRNTLAKATEEERRRKAAIVRESSEGRSNNSVKKDETIERKEEFIEEENRKITKVIFIKIEETIVYKKIVYKWGGIYFFRNDMSISEIYYNMATKK